MDDLNKQLRENSKKLLEAITNDKAKGKKGKQRADALEEEVKELLESSADDLLNKAEQIVPMIAGGGAATEAMMPDASAALQMSDGAAKQEPAQADVQPSVGPEDLKAYVYGAVLDEVKAVAIYEALEGVCADKAMAAIMRHIRDEEVQHIEELKQVVANLQRLSSGSTGAKTLCLGKPVGS